jgi:hypothetical protein
MGVRWDRRRVVRSAAVVVMALLALNTVGLLRYPGGPLREEGIDAPLWLDIPPSNQGSSAVGFHQPNDWALAGRPLYYGLLTLHNPWPWPATVEAITPIDPSPGLVVEAVYVSRPGSVATETATIWTEPLVPAGQRFDEAFSGLPAAVEPNRSTNEADARTLLVVRADQPGLMGFSALAVDYRVGPLTFHVVEHLALRGCLGPLPSGAECPDEEPQATTNAVPRATPGRPS